MTINDKWFIIITETKKGQQIAEKEQAMKKEENIKRVRFNDYSNYDPEKCHDGGAYGFWTNFYRTEANSDTWEAEYHTTADFGFCPCCGRFDENDHWDGGEAGYNSGYSCGEFATFTTDELLKKINNPEAEEDGIYWEFE